MTFKDFFSFDRNRYFWINILMMVVAVFGLLFGVLKWVDAYTRHGEAVLVPDVKGMRVAEAEKLFRNKGLACAVADSSYVKELPAGCILEYTPSAGQKVKEGRLVYLTINTLTIPLHIVPDVADNSSLRQAEARMLASGFKLAETEYISGEKDWVYGVKYQGRELLTGAKVPEGAVLTLVVGDGGELPLDADSLGGDSIALGKRSVPSGSAAGKSGHSETDESWF